MSWDVNPVQKRLWYDLENARGVDLSAYLPGALAWAIQYHREANSWFKFLVVYYAIRCAASWDDGDSETLERKSIVEQISRVFPQTEERVRDFLSEQGFSQDDFEVLKLAIDAWKRCALTPREIRKRNEDAKALGLQIEEAAP